MGFYALIEATNLPDSSIAAAREFYGPIVNNVRERVRTGDDVVILFSHADHTHASWRLAAVQELAREAAPRRVNAVVGNADAEVLRYLANAPGVTGQVLQTDDNPAANE